MTSRPRSSAANQRATELYYSAPLLWVASLALALVACYIGFWIVAGLMDGRRSLSAIMGLSCLLVLPILLAFGLPVMRAWRHKGPVVVLDTEGIADARKEVGFIPWSDIGNIQLGAGNNARFLCFEFRVPDRQRQDIGRLGVIGSILSRSRSLSDWNVSLGLLACRKRDVLRTAQRLHQQSIRQQVVELNKGRPSGWSGTL